MFYLFICFWVVYSGHTAPSDLLSVRLLPTAFHYSAIDHIDNEDSDCATKNCVRSDDHPATASQVLFLQASEFYDNAYFIVNEKNKQRLFCYDGDNMGDSGEVRSTNGALKDSQLWTFEAVKDGKYNIKEFQGKKRNMLSFGASGPLVCYDQNAKITPQKYYATYASSYYWRWQLNTISGAQQAQGWTDDFQFWAYSTPVPGLKTYYLSLATGEYWRYRISQEPESEHAGEGWYDQWKFWAFDYQEAGTKAYHVMRHNPYGRKDDLVRYKFATEKENANGWKYIFTFYAYPGTNKPSNVDVNAQTEWYVQDIYESDALWDSICKYNNQSPPGTPDQVYRETKSWGYTKSYESTTGHTYGFGQSLTVSASFKIFGKKLSTDMTADFNQEISNSVSQAEESVFTDEKEILVYSPAGSCLNLVHFKVDQKDLVTQTGSANYFKDLYLRDCSTCNWIDGFADGKAEMLGALDGEAACKEEVQERRPDANAVSWNFKTKECWAIEDSSQINKHESMYTCVFGYSGKSDEDQIANTDKWCPASHPFAYRPAEGFDYCCQTSVDQGGDPWAAGGSKESCYLNAYVPCPIGMGCVNRGTSAQRSGALQLLKRDFKVGKVKLDCEGIVRDASCAEAAGDALFMTTEAHTSVHPVVYGLAGIGVVYAFYGAFHFYFGKTQEAYMPEL